MLSRKQVIVIMSMAVVSFLFGTMFNFTTTVTGDSGSPWDRVWTTISELQSRVEILEDQSLPEGFVNAPAYDSGWVSTIGKTMPMIFEHGLGTTNVLVYVVAKTSDWTGIHQRRFGSDFWWGKLSDNEI